MSVVQLNNPLPIPKSNETLADVLETAKQTAVAEGLKYSGRVTPDEAWKLFVNGQAHIVDVRAAEERKFVGHVPNTFHVAWQTGPALIKNPRLFARS